MLKKKLKYFIVHRIIEINLWNFKRALFVYFFDFFYFKFSFYFFPHPIQALKTSVCIQPQKTLEPTKCNVSTHKQSIYIRKKNFCAKYFCKSKKKKYFRPKTKPKPHFLMNLFLL